MIILFTDVVADADADIESADANFAGAHVHPTTQHMSERTHVPGAC